MSKPDNDCRACWRSALALAVTTRSYQGLLTPPGRHDRVFIDDMQDALSSLTPEDFFAFLADPTYAFIPDAIRRHQQAISDGVFYQSRVLLAYFLARRRRHRLQANWGEDHAVLERILSDMGIASQRYQ